MNSENLQHCCVYLLMHIKQILTFFFEQFYESMAFKHEIIRVHDDSKHLDKEMPCTAACYIEGVMEGVTDDGFLKLRTPEGKIEHICMWNRHKKVKSTTVIKTTELVGSFSYCLFNNVVLC